MNNRINNKKISDEIIYLKEYRHKLIQKKYSLVVELINLFFIRNAIESITYKTHSSLINLWKNISGIMKVDNQFHELIAGINHYSSDFFKNHCKEGCIPLIAMDERYLRKSFDLTLFIDYLKLTGTKGKELLSNHCVNYIPVPADRDLLHFIDKASRFSKDYYRLLTYNADIKKMLNQLPDQVLHGYLSQNFIKLVSTLDMVFKNLTVYTEDKLVRFEINLKNDVIDHALFSATSVLLIFFLPFEAVLANFIARKSANGFNTYLIQPYIAPKIIKKLKQWEKTKLSLQDRSAIKEKKPHGVIVLEQQVTNLSHTVNRLEVVKIIFYSICSIGFLASLPSIILRETQENPHHPFLLFFFPIQLSMLSVCLAYLKNTIFQFYSDFNLESDIEKAKKILNDAAESVRSKAVKAYKRETMAESCFFLSVQETLPLSVKQVAILVKNALQDNFCIVKDIEETDNTDVIDLEIKMTSFPDTDKLRDAISYAFNRLKSITILSQQMKKLGKIIGAYVAIIPTQHLGKTIDETILAFLFDKNAHFWLTVLKKQPLFQGINIIQNEHRLIMQTSYFEKNTFEQMLSYLGKIYNKRINQTLPKVFSPGFFAKPEGIKAENNNEYSPKNDKIKTHKTIYTVNQLPSKAASPHIHPSQPLVTSTKSTPQNILEELDFLPPKISRSPFWSKTTSRYLKFSLTLEHFGRNKIAFSYCSAQADKAKMGYNPAKKKKKPGLILVNDESLHAKDCITGEDFIVKGKMKVKSKKNGIGKIRMYAKMAKWLIFKGTPDEQVIEGYDLRAVSMKHK